MNIWFTSDNHLGCDKLVSNSRKEFASCDEHDRELIRLINKYVDRNDLLVIIGDFCKSKPGKYRTQLKCRNHFYILGNHCNERKTRAVFGGQVWLQKMVKGRINNNMYFCSHCPHFSWDRSHYGVFHCYGHWHDNAKLETMLDLGAPGRLSLDVGVDAARRILGEYRPFAEHEILERLGGRSGHETIKQSDRWN